VKQKYITLLPIALLALSASYGIYSFSLLFVPWLVALITALSFELVYCTLVFIDSSKAKPVSIMAVIVSVLWNIGHSLFVLYPASLEMVYSSLVLSVILAAIHGVPLATLAYLVADVSLHVSPSAKQDNKDSEIEFLKNEILSKDSEIEFLNSEIEKMENRLYEVVMEMENERSVSSSETTRNEQIILDKQGGMTYADLSNKYGISERRVRQIVKGV
jgi:hypothetical protein